MSVFKFKTLQDLLHPILAGFCAFLGTIIGSSAFNL